MSDSATPPGSSVNGILQARILEWVTIPFSRESSQPRDRTWVSCLGRWILYHLSHQGSPWITKRRAYSEVNLQMGYCATCFPYTVSKSSVFTHSVQLSRSVVSNSLRPHESQHTRPPCPSPTPGVHSDSRPWSR